MRRTLTCLLLGTLVCLAGDAFADGPGEIKFDERSFEVIEEAGVAVVTVERSRGEDGAVSIDYATTDGSATEGADYTGVSGTLSWAAGDGSDRTFSVPILDDAEAEGVETVTLALSNPAGGATIRADRGTSVLRILASDGGAGGPGGDDGGDHAGRIKLDQRNFVTTEGAGVAVISVERSRGEDGEVSVEYATEDGSAVAGEDYKPVSGVLTWAAGDGSRKTFQVPLVNDAAREHAEHLRLNLSNPTGGAIVDPARGWARVTIVDNDQGDAVPPGDDDRPGTLKFDERGYQAIEGEQTLAVISVERSRGAAGMVSVDYATVDATAMDGEDYTGVAGTLTWDAGDRSVKFFAVPILDDDLQEGNETAELVLSNATGGARIDPARGESRLTILDNDGSTAACIEDDDTLCLEEDRFQVEVVWRTGDGNTGAGGVIPSTESSGLVWFFEPDNAELLIKVLDACVDPFDRYWVFFAATTNVDFTVTVTDTATGVVKEYANPLGQAADPVQDTVSFDTCP